MEWQHIYEMVAHAYVQYNRNEVLEAAENSRNKVSAGTTVQSVPYMTDIISHDGQVACAVQGYKHNFVQAQHECCSSSYYKHDMNVPPHFLLFRTGSSGRPLLHIAPHVCSSYSTSYSQEPPSSARVPGHVHIPHRWRGRVLLTSYNVHVDMSM
jgi:hypothetical protein